MRYCCDHGRHTAHHRGHGPAHRRRPRVLHDRGLRPDAAQALQSALDIADPYPVVTTARHLCDEVLELALADVVDQRLLHEVTGRRIPLQELPSRTLRPLTARHRLSPEQVDALHFVLCCTFAYPGIVGTPTRPSR
ncbi:hypothetical protein NKH18_47860 [Streptomyces sp. M10(2022)]